MNQIKIDWGGYTVGAIVKCPMWNVNRPCLACITCRYWRWFDTPVGISPNAVTATDMLATHVRCDYRCAKVPLLKPDPKPTAEDSLKGVLKDALKHALEEML